MLACVQGAALVSFAALIEGTLQARSSVVEHHLDMVVVGGSIPLAPTRFSKGVRGNTDALSSAKRAPPEIIQVKFECP